MAVGEKRKGICSKCELETEFKTILYSSSTETNDTEDIFVWTTWSADVCLNSGHVRFFRSSSCSEEFDDNGQIAESVDEMYLDDIRLWNCDLVRSLSDELQNFYFETMVACHMKSNVLAAAGIRAIVERACVEIGIEGVKKSKKTGGTYFKNDLEGKIEELANRGVLVDEFAALNQLRLLGNEGIHELSRPSTDELNHALDIVEHMLDEIFHRPARAKKIAGKGLEIENERKRRRKH